MKSMNWPTLDNVTSAYLPAKRQKSEGGGGTVTALSHPEATIMAKLRVAEEGDLTPMSPLENIFNWKASLICVYYNFIQNIKSYTLFMIPF